MSAKNGVKAIPLTSIDSSAVGSSYAAINTGGLPNACSYLVIINDSDEDITVSYDGTNDHDYIEKASRIALPASIMSVPNNFVALFAAGTVVYVKGTSGTGSIYLAGYYVAGGG